MIGVSSGDVRGIGTNDVSAGSMRRSCVNRLARDRDDRSAARLGFLHIAQHLLEHVIVGRDRHDRHVLVDERDRPVLHLAGRVPLGVDVRDLLQLERTLERDRVVEAPPEEEEIAAASETFSATRSIAADAESPDR